MCQFFMGTIKLSIKQLYFIYFLFYHLSNLYLFSKCCLFYLDVCLIFNARKAHKKNHLNLNIVW